MLWLDKWLVPKWVPISNINFFATSVGLLGIAAKTNFGTCNIE